MFSSLAYTLVKSTMIQILPMLEPSSIGMGANLLRSVDLLSKIRGMLESIEGPHGTPRFLCSLIVPVKRLPEMILGTRSTP